MGAESINLRAGPLELSLDGPDLRYISYEGEEIVRRIYMAVRDLDWETIAAVEHERSVEAAEDSFSVRMKLSNHGGEIAFDWTLEIDGAADGTIEYVMRAQATASFEFAKIGLNLHHPIVGLAGRRWSGNADGTEVGGVMPERIYPQVELRDLGLHVPMLPPVSELTLDQQAGTVRLDFGGDLYETEDQRNWSDASYKTYSMPAFTGYRHGATEGEEFVQQVRLEFEPREERPRLATRHSAGPPAEDPGRLELGPSLGRAVPAVGLGFSEAVGAAEDERFRLLRPAHLRLDLDLELGSDAWEARLSAALACCAKIGAGLELALFPAGDPRRSLAWIAAAVEESGAHLARVLVFPTKEEATPAAWIPLVRANLPIEAPVGGGTNLYFNELFRSLPDLRPFPLISWSLNPQVHAFTDGDLVENLDGQGEQLRSALAFAGDRQLCLSPVTLKPRFNAVAREGVPGGENADPRQSTLFTAAWTIGSARQMAEGGADSVTYYETVGRRGVLEGADTFPVFHAIADLAELRGAELLSFHSGEEPWLSGMAVRHRGSLVALVANLSGRRRTVEVRLGEAGIARLRLLDDASEQLARGDPEAFRRQDRTVEAIDGVFALDLGAYGTARFELV